MKAPKSRSIRIPLKIELQAGQPQIVDSRTQKQVKQIVGNYAQQLVDDLGIPGKVLTTVTLAAGKYSQEQPYRLSVNDQACRLEVRSEGRNRDSAVLAALISGDVFENRQLFLTRAIARKLREVWKSACGGTFAKCQPPVFQAFLESLAIHCLSVSPLPGGTESAAGETEILENALSQAAGVALTLSADEPSEAYSSIRQVVATEIEQPFFEDYGLVIPPITVATDEVQKSSLRLRINQLRTPLQVSIDASGYAQLRDQIFRVAPALVTLDSVRLALNLVRDQFPRLVETALNRFPFVTMLTPTLRELVTESVPLKDMRGVLEALLNVSGETSADLESKIAFPSNAGDLCPVRPGRTIGPPEFADCVRAWLKSQIATTYSQHANQMTVYLVGSEIEEWVRHRRDDSVSPAERDKLVSAVADIISPEYSGGGTPILLTTVGVRRALRRFIEKELPSTVVLSFQELPPELGIVTAGRISW